MATRDHRALHSLASYLQTAHFLDAGIALWAQSLWAAVGASTAPFVEQQLSNDILLRLASLPENLAESIREQHPAVTASYMTLAEKLQAAPQCARAAALRSCVQQGSLHIAPALCCRHGRTAPTAQLRTHLAATSPQAAPTRLRLKHSAWVRKLLSPRSPAHHEVQSVEEMELHTGPYADRYRVCADLAQALWEQSKPKLRLHLCDEDLCGCEFDAAPVSPILAAADMRCPIEHMGVRASYGTVHGCSMGSMRLCKLLQQGSWLVQTLHSLSLDFRCQVSAQNWHYQVAALTPALEGLASSLAGLPSLQALQLHTSLPDGGKPGRVKPGNTLLLPLCARLTRLTVSGGTLDYSQACSLPARLLASCLVVQSQQRLQHLSICGMRSVGFQAAHLRKQTALTSLRIRLAGVWCSQLHLQSLPNLQHLELWHPDGKLENVRALVQALPALTKLQHLAFRGLLQTAADYANMARNLRSSSLKHLAIDVRHPDQPHGHLSNEAVQIAEHVGRLRSLQALLCPCPVLQAAPEAMTSALSALPELQALTVQSFSSLSRSIGTPGSCFATLMKQLTSLTHFKLEAASYSDSLTHEAGDVLSALESLSKLRRLTLSWTCFNAQELLYGGLAHTLGRLTQVAHIALGPRKLSSCDLSALLTRGCIAELTNLTRLQLVNSLGELQQLEEGRHLLAKISDVALRPAECVIAPFDDSLYEAWCEVRGERQA